MLARLLCLFAFFLQPSTAVVTGCVICIYSASVPDSDGWGGGASDPECTIYKETVNGNGGWAFLGRTPRIQNDNTPDWGAGYCVTDQIDSTAQAKFYCHDVDPWPTFADDLGEAYIVAGQATGVEQQLTLDSGSSYHISISIVLSYPPFPPPPPPRWRRRSGQRWREG